MPWKCSPGNCYTDAFMVAIEGRYNHIENLRIVHGYPRLTMGNERHPLGTKFGHAWLEGEWAGERVCITPISDTVVPAGLFYAVGRVEDEPSTYTLEEAMRLAGETGHVGPWEDAPADAVFDDSDKTTAE